MNYACSDPNDETDERETGREREIKDIIKTLAKYRIITIKKGERKSNDEKAPRNTGGLKCAEFHVTPWIGMCVYLS